ncbi:MAG: hypothetical protein V1846_00145 [Candidatus Komeilibacteria bacterium]
MITMLESDGRRRPAGLEMHLLVWCASKRDQKGNAVIWTNDPDYFRRVLAFRLGADGQWRIGRSRKKVEIKIQGSLLDAAKMPQRPTGFQAGATFAR